MIEKAIQLLILLVLILIYITIVKMNYCREDLNRDGVVNSADLLYLRKYIIEMREKWTKKKFKSQ